MKDGTNVCWVRLSRVVESSGLSINAFALSIGLPRGENLYQIRRGNNGISRDLAERIHKQYPQFSIGWLMFGVIEPEDIRPEDAAKIVRIPLYRDLEALTLPPASEPNEHLILSASEAMGAEWATPYADDILNPFLRNSILLLKRQPLDNILFGNIYLVVLEDSRIFRIVEQCKGNPTCLTLKDLPDWSGFKTVVRREKVISLWLVVGAVCKFVR